MYSCSWAKFTGARECWVNLSKKIVGDWYRQSCLRTLCCRFERSTVSLLVQITCTDNTICVTRNYKWFVDNPRNSCDFSARLEYQFFLQNNKAHRQKVATLLWEHLLQRAGESPFWPCNLCFPLSSWSRQCGNRLTKTWNVDSDHRTLAILLSF